VERDEREELNRVVDREVKGHFPAGSVRRAVLLRHGDEPGIEAGPGSAQPIACDGPQGRPGRGDREPDNRERGRRPCPSLPA